MSKPPKIGIPGLNRGAGIPAGFVLGRRRGKGKGPAELLDLAEMQGAGLAKTALVTQLVASLSTAIGTPTTGTGALTMLGMDGQDGEDGLPTPGTPGPAGAPGITTALLDLDGGAASVTGTPILDLDGGNS